MIMRHRPSMFRPTPMKANAFGRRMLKILACSAAVALVALSGGTAFSEIARTIKIIVPLPPGGAGDIFARPLAEQGGRAEGATVITEKRPGAGSIIGTEAGARAPPHRDTPPVK